MPASAHENPQEPQLAGSSVVSTQTPLQSVCPVMGHMQSPAGHVEPAGHTFPQLPQLFTSVVVFTQVFVPTQRSGNEGLLHEATHVDPLHALLPWVGGVGDGHVAHTPGAAPHCSVPLGHA